MDSETQKRKRSKRIMQVLVTTAIQGGVAVAALFARTSLEDRTLQAELPGYLDLIQQTPYRQLPGLW